jgi:hypothetical protein
MDSAQLEQVLICISAALIPAFVYTGIGRLTDIVDWFPCNAWQVGRVVSAAIKSNSGRHTPDLGIGDDKLMHVAITHVTQSLKELTVTVSISPR